MKSEDCYKTWNGGQGAIVVVDPDKVKSFMIFANVFGIDAKVAGKITEKKDYTILIKSKFSKGEIVKFKY